MGSFLQKIYTFIAFSTSVFKFGSIVQKMRILSPTIELWRKINTKLILAHFLTKPDHFFAKGVDFTEFLLQIIFKWAIWQKCIFFLKKPEGLVA